MLDKKTFVCMYKKAIGASQAAKMFDEAQSIQKEQKTHSEVFLNEFGNEVHVNGDMAASMLKGETLKERIARFDKLAATVAALRLARFAEDPDHFDEFDEDVNDDSLLDDIEIRDDFGDKVEKPSSAEQKDSASAAQSMPAASVSGDEPVDASGTDSGMQTDDSVVD